MSQYLTNWEGSPDDQYVPLPLLLDEQQLLSPVAILKQREVQVLGKWWRQVLVQWDSDVPSSWEFIKHIREHYPFFDLEDKVLSDGDRYVMNGKNNADVVVQVENVNKVYGANQGERQHVALDPGPAETTI